ncbi:proline--tRNA ligase [Candidatus Woesearchaeota archaeon]|nr:proline--tRNA ligase [Candidatus Woesearchaeota archaeon]
MISVKTNKEEDFVKWYHEVIEASKLVDFSAVKGCVVYHEYCLMIWSLIKSYLDNKLMPLGFKEYYFPALIPLKSFKKQTKHFEDFFREVLVVSKAGHSTLEEEYVIRPTSEAIIYESLAKWVKEEKHLPLCINQYCSVMRWESFKPNMPLLRGNEFLWQESHSVHSTKKEADEYVRKILDVYRDLHENCLAMPVISGFKPEHRMFPGAEYTLALESLMPDFKSVQTATSHYLGQNFSKAFSIKFRNKSGKGEFAYQACNGITTRVIGALAMLHGDNKGLVIPPKIAPYQVVFADFNEKMFDLLKNNGIRVFNDESKKSNNEKIGYWILMGAPIIVLSEKNNFTLIRRDTLEKTKTSKNLLLKEIQKTLNSIQDNLCRKAKEFHSSHISKVGSWQEFEKIASGKKGFIEALWCGSIGCAKQIREKANKNSVRVVRPIKSGKCVHCGKKAAYSAVFAPAY